MPHIIEKIADDKTEYHERKKGNTAALVLAAHVTNLHAENGILRRENRRLKDAIEKIQANCQTRDVLSGEVPFNEYVQRLTLENSKLKEENSHSIGILCDSVKTWALKAAMNVVKEVIQMALKEKLNTKATSVVLMAGITLVETFMDVNKWMEMFPCIVTTAKTLHILSPGLSPPDKNGLPQLMHAKLQVPSPLGCVREIGFFRYCHQLSEIEWSVVDFSHHKSTSLSTCISGRIIQQLPNGQSKATWVDNSEPLHKVLDAQRWVALLYGKCQQLATLDSTELGVNVHYKRAKATSQLFELFIFLQWRFSKEHNRLVIFAGTSLWLPVSRQRLFGFLRDERMRSKWELSLEGKSIQEMKHIATGPQSGNDISLLMASIQYGGLHTAAESNRCTSMSLIVYSSLDVEAVIHAMMGEYPSSTTLLPSAFRIRPQDSAVNTASSSTSGSDISRNEGSSLQIISQVVCCKSPEEPQQRLSDFVWNTAANQSCIL
ncbi:homeobox-leucine zipper protein HDG7-like [Cryptomeria japonica]|uniref:homeobox-leucine zipper protein HDG7-like n=1 Tax=Cryptomeria japonica TaxID=3369 RepID=UPI0027D9DECE|nr:homeobox-leucine zipper protein HDG7-like [Cryptomeria japonica]